MSKLGRSVVDHRLAGVFWLMAWAKAWRTRKQWEKIAGLHEGDNGLAV